MAAVWRRNQPVEAKRSCSATRVARPQLCRLAFSADTFDGRL